MDRAEATGFGVAALGHAALFAALALGFAKATQPPAMSSPIEVSFVDEIGLESAVTEVTTEPPAQSVAPEMGPPEEAAPAPAPSPEPQPVQKPALKQAATKPAPVQPAKPKASQSGTAKATRGSRLGDDFLKGIGNDPSPSRSQKPAGTVLSAQALAGIKSAIERQIQPCANRQVNPGPGANEILVTLNIRLNRDGSLARRPSVVGTRGVTDRNSRYEERVKDLAIASYVGCSPLRGLPEEYYQTPKGGWANLNMSYKLPG